ncbi:acyl-CoA reductase-like NAD-dependent aldehyde dehydrogenase [Bradyrhizobium elkanii]|jgi:hypothetical protein|nr:acyl-CoA reductase-like NAD-dependent aldehyde dehydrogenase [Bradyrhizobium elkanii]
MISVALCQEAADHYSTLSRQASPSEDRAAVLKNIARTLRGLAGQLDRLASLERTLGK